MSAKVACAIGPKPATSGSWCTVSTPSALRRTSSSTPSAPSKRAVVNAATVFSGAAADAPGDRARAGDQASAATLRGRDPETRSTFDRVRPDQTPCIAGCTDVACERRQLPGQSDFPGELVIGRTWLWQRAFQCDPRKGK